MHRRNGRCALAHLAAVLVLAALPAAANAYTVTVKTHGNGTVAEVSNRFGDTKNQVGCSFAATSRSESSVSDCVMGTADGLWNHGNIVRLQASVPTESFNRGWRFFKWVDGTASKQINCDPSDQVGDHTLVYCEFQIFDNLYVDLYFDDIQGPQDTSIGGGPSGVTNQTTASFSFDAASDPGATFECRLDRPGVTGAYTACGSPFDKSESYSQLTANGDYAFSVRAVDPSGNPDATPATRTWTVDTVPPPVSIIAGPENGSVTRQTVTSFTVTTSAGSSLSCTLDNQPVGCQATHQGLTDGSHVFTARASDSAGNQSPTVTRTWTVDTTAPVPVIAGSPAAGATTTSTQTAFAVSTNEGTLACALDGAPVACAATHSGLADGPHTFAVTATDAAGNQGSASRSWTVDTTAPETTISGTPAEGSSVTATTADFTIGSPEPGVTFECSVDGGPFEPCGAALSLSGLAVGSHVVLARALDALGNRDGTPAERRWTVVAPPPAQPPADPGPAPATGTSTTAPDPGPAAETGGSSSPALAPSPGQVVASFARSGRRTRVVSLAVRGLLAGARVRLTCSGKACKARTVKAPANGRVTLLRGRKLPAGVTLTIRITTPGHAPVRVRYVTRRGKNPLRL